LLKIGQWVNDQTGAGKVNWKHEKRALILLSLLSLLYPRQVILYDLTRSMAYTGEKLNVESTLSELRRLAEKEDFQIETLTEIENFPIYAFSRSAESEGPVIYLSAGIHGDEPAGPLAI